MHIYKANRLFLLLLPTRSSRADIYLSNGYYTLIFSSEASRDGGISSSWLASFSQDGMGNSYFRKYCIEWTNSNVILRGWINHVYAQPVPGKDPMGQGS